MPSPRAARRSPPHMLTTKRAGIVASEGCTVHAGRVRAIRLGVLVLGRLYPDTYQIVARCPTSIPSEEKGGASGGKVSFLPSLSVYP